ncbi:MAG TPA: Gldg family protein [Candidatus Limnocylindria bacterium]|jgi:ABC-type uncharacterized transport system involved in gliding motility auxiliary subunit|nr:Gldg family protein [Candidatus Limnocylindria bacterium]
MPEPQSSFEPGRRLRASATVTFGTLAVLAIVLMLNYLSATRVDTRLDLGAGTRAPLSPLTVATLNALTNDLTVVMLYSSESDLFPQVRTMLREYTRLSSHVHLQHVDYEQRPNEAEVLKARYHLSNEAGDMVIFAAGADRFRVVNDNEMSTYDADVGAMLSGRSKEIRRVGFRGESLFTSAIGALSDPTEAHAYFIAGHGARRPENQDDKTGYRTFADLLVERNVTWSVLTNTFAAVPADCQLLILAGPTDTLFPHEAKAIDDYLKRGGRALILLHTATTGSSDPLQQMLHDWSIELPPQQASDMENSAGGLDILTSHFGNHPITSPLARTEERLAFPWPRVVRAASEKSLPADAPRATVIVTTGPNGKTKSPDPEGGFTFQPGIDYTGEVPLAVTVEHGAVGAGGSVPTTTRLVVIGDALVFANTVLRNSGNRAFASLTIGWLLDRSQTLAIGPKAINEYRLNLNEKQKRLLVIFMAGVLPGTVMLAGVAVWLRRRA